LPAVLAVAGAAVLIVHAALLGDPGITSFTSSARCW